MIPRAWLSPEERGLYSRLQELASRPGLLRGNLVLMRRACGKAGCRCARSPRGRHRSLYLGLKIDGRQHMVYVPAAWEERVREWAQRHAEIRGVLERLCSAFLKRLRRREG